MNPMIGGMFGLQDTVVQPTPPPFLDRQTLGLVNARSCLRVLVDRLEPKQVWLPSYLCESVLVALLPAVCKLRFFEMTSSLIFASDKWIDELQVGDIVVFIAYFGFPNDESMASRVRQKGAILVTDACQALLTNDLGGPSDFVLYSPRKFLGVPDGGILVNRCGIDLGPIDLQSVPAAWWNVAFQAVERRREFDFHGGGRSWFELFQQVEKEQPVGSYAITDFTVELLRKGFDYPKISDRRRENFCYLRDHLADLAVFRDLPDGVVPIGFPMVVPNRDHLCQRLFEKDIYPPIHWSIPDAVPDIYTGSRQLAGQILTMPCDQRYTCVDMRRIVDSVREFLEH